MANKSDFTPEEWTKVLESIMVAGIAVSAADPSGLWGTVKEAAATSSSLAAAKRDPNSSEFIKAVIADFETSEGRSNIQNAMRDESPRWLSPLLKRAAYAEGAPTPCSIKGNRLEVRSRTRPPVRNLFYGSFGGLLHNLLTQWIAQCGWLFRPRRRGASSYRFAFVCKKMCRKMETVALTTCRARLDVAPHESGLVH